MKKKQGYIEMEQEMRNKQGYINKEPANEK